MRSKIHITNVCCVDFDLDETIPPLAKNLYRILKAHVRKGSDFTTAQFVRPSRERLRKIMRVGTDKVDHSLKVLQLVGLVVVHPGKRIGKKNEVNEYEIIDDLLIYKPGEGMKLGADKDLFDENIVLELFSSQDFPQPPPPPPPVEYPEEIVMAAGLICDELSKRKSPGVITDTKQWSKVIDGILKQYKETKLPEVLQTALYGVKDNFWSVHIIRPSKFKSKFPILYRQKYRNTKTSFGIPNNQERSKLD
jgi:hypothetical protein